MKVNENMSQDETGEWWIHSAYTHNDKTYQRRRKARVKTCTECNKEFVTAPSRKNTRCSRSCGAKSVARTGSDNPFWKGGRFQEPRGYVRVWISNDDPLVSMRFIGAYVHEHRLVMARAIGRPLEAHEQVHHRNGVKSDNRLENLELWSVAHPPGKRVEDLVEWAHQILDLYAPVGASLRG